MKRLPLLVALLLVYSFSWAGLSCPEGTEAACIEPGDKLCGETARCVDQSATCFDAFPCDVEAGFVCAAEYDAALNDHKRSTEQYDQLATENVDLRQERLDRKNCVLNATELTEAQRCVR